MSAPAFAFAAANRVSAGAMARVSRSQIPGFLQNDGGSRPDFAFERQMIAHYGAPVAGIDEVGRGPWAGPVVAAAVCLDPALPCPAGVNDSKQLSEAARARLFEQIAAITLSWGVGEASAEEIAALNIRQATHLAMRRALDAAAAGPSAPKAVLVDGNDAPDLPVPARAIVKGDARSLSIAAASIIAKVTRDRIMAEADARHPGYGFAQHKGYGTAQHAEALERLGPCPLHRLTFAPVAARLLR